MRIEIIGSSSEATSTLSGLYTDFDSLLAETDSIVSALNKLKSFSCNMSGGIGILQDAVERVDNRLQSMENKRNDLISAKDKCECFLQLVSTVDSQVADSVSQNQEEFYQLNQWSRPSALRTTVESWYQSAKEWVESASKTVVDCFNHVLNVYSETDFSELSDDELQEYYNNIIEALGSSNASVDDEIRAKALLNYLYGQCSISNDDKINKFVELFEILFPDQADRIENARKKYENERGSSVSNVSKYEIYSQYLEAGNVSDEFIQNQFEVASKYPASLYYKYCRAQKNNKYVGLAGTVDETLEVCGKGTNRTVNQGTTHVYNFEKHNNEDGSIDVTFKASNKTKCYTEITLYDADGSIISREYLSGQKDPSSISGVIFGEGRNMVNDLVNGKVFSVDSESFNSKEEYSFCIPSGGYIKITEDPSEMNQGSYKQEKINDMSTKAVDITVDTVNVKTGNNVVDFGINVFKDILVKNTTDEIKGKQTSITDYADTAVSTTIDTLVDTIANSGSGNPAEIGLVGIKGILKLNSATESYVSEIKQNKSIGNGSLYIYN